MTIGNTWAYGVDLRASIKKKERDALDRASPYRDPAKPAIYLGWLHEPPERRFPENDFSRSGSRLVKRFGMEISGDYRSRHSNKEGALSKLRDWSLTLRGAGWSVLTQKMRRRWSVYVVELDREVFEEREGLEKLNPDRDPELPPLYVGMTHHTPTDRFERHRAGDVTASSYVRDFGFRLRPDLFAEYNPMTELDAFRRERSLANLLRECGFAVAGGH